MAIQFVRSLRRAWPSSPILDKEMRVSSRRKGVYLLRAAYLALLTLFVAFTWMDVTRSFSGASPAYISAYMAEAGKKIIVVILWFQFVAAQVIALFTLGTAIPAEIVRGTMATLACTPLTPFQIVWGKLLSKLLQVILLVAMSLPLLAVVRVFGGVPWGTVVAGLAVTLSSTLLVGAWSLMLSVRSRSLLRILAIIVFSYALFFGLGGALMGVDPPLPVGVGPLASIFYATGTGYIGVPYLDSLWISIACNCVAMIGLALLFLRKAAGRLREEIAIPASASRKRRPAPRPVYAAGTSQGLSYLPWPGNIPAPAPPLRPLPFLAYAGLGLLLARRARTMMRRRLFA